MKLVKLKQIHVDGLPPLKSRNRNRTKVKLPLIRSQRGVATDEDMPTHVFRETEFPGRRASASELAERPSVDDRILLEASTAQKSWHPFSAQIQFACLYVARNGRPGLLGTVNILARSVAEWNKACGKGIGTVDQLHRSHDKPVSAVQRAARQVVGQFFRKSASSVISGALQVQLISTAKDKNST